MLPTYILLLAVVLALAMGVTSAADKELNFGDTSVKILGQSGKMTVTLIDTTGSKNTTSTTTVEIGSLSEVDSTGTIVGKTGNPKHSINTFANQDFTFASPVEVPVGTATATSIEMTSPISSIGQIVFTTFIIKTEGEVTNGEEPISETLPLKVGDVKFSIALDSWTFCDPCSDGTAAFIDVEIISKGSNDSDDDTSTTDLVDSDSGSEDGLDVKMGLSRMILSAIVDVDGTWQSMPTGYPKLEASNNGDQNTLTFRFPKFSTFAMYDPIITLNTNSNGLSTGAIIGIVGGALVLAGVAMWLCVGVKRKAKTAELAGEDKLISANP